MEKSRALPGSKRITAQLPRLPSLFPNLGLHDWAAVKLSKNPTPQSSPDTTRGHSSHAPQDLGKGGVPAAVTPTDQWGFQDVCSNLNGFFNISTALHEPIFIIRRAISRWEHLVSMSKGAQRDHMIFPRSQTNKCVELWLELPSGSFISDKKFHMHP